MENQNKRRQKKKSMTLTWVFFAWFKDEGIATCDCNWEHLQTHATLLNMSFHFLFPEHTNKSYIFKITQSRVLVPSFTEVNSTFILSFRTYHKINNSNIQIREADKLVTDIYLYL